MEFQEISEKEFEQLERPKGPTKKIDPQVEALLSALQAGKIVRIPIASEKELKGKRLSIGRRAMSRGFKVEFRYGEGFLAVRKVQELAEPLRMGRPRKPRDLKSAEETFSAE